MPQPGDSDLIAGATTAFISSAFVPTASMPGLVRVIAENQPVGNDLWVALAWCIGIMLVAYVFVMRAYQKRV